MMIRAVFPYLEHQYKVEQYADMLRRVDLDRLLPRAGRKKTGYSQVIRSSLGMVLVRLGCRLQGHDANQFLAAVTQARPS